LILIMTGRIQRSRVGLSGDAYFYFPCDQALPPGSYQSVVVHAGCALTLSEGVFNVYELIVYSDAELNIAGTVALNAESKLQIGDRSVVGLISDPNHFKVYTNQQSQVRIGVDTAFTGHIAAPFAEVVVSPNASFDGCIHSNRVVVEPGAFLAGDSFGYSNAICGNGVVEPGELCDDGNSDNSDDCLSSCVPATCDDGYWHMDKETDVDCGAECPPCGNQKQCLEHADCESFLCENGLCSGDSSVVASLNVNNNWGTGYCAEVILHNQGDFAVSTWTAIVNANDSVVYDLWNGEYTQSANEYTVTPKSYNGTINPGESQSFGFCANSTGPSYLPDIVSVFAE
jgi:hypothetical protein